MYKYLFTCMPLVRYALNIYHCMVTRGGYRNSGREGWSNMNNNEGGGGGGGVEVVRKLLETPHLVALVVA